MKTSKIVVLVAALGFAAGFGLACSSESDECKTIQETCHAVDPGSGPIHECHENAEGEWSKDQCAAMSAGCLALCKAAPADGGTGG